MAPIDYFIKNAPLKGLIKKLAQGNAEDFYQDMCIYILMEDQEYMEALIEMDKFEFHMVRVIINQTKSTSSKFFKDYKMVPDPKKFRDEMNASNLPDESLQLEDMREIIEEFINSPHDLTEWVENSIMRKYIQHGSTQKVSDAMGGIRTKEAIKYYVRKFKSRFFHHLEKKYTYNKE